MKDRESHQDRKSVRITEERTALTNQKERKEKNKSGAAHPLVACPLPLNDAPLLTTSFNKKAHAPNPKKSK